MNLINELQICLGVIEKLAKNELKEKVKSCQYNELYKFHFGMGMYIRNELLSVDSELWRSITEKCPDIQKDDISELIIKLFYLYLNTK